MSYKYSQHATKCHVSIRHEANFNGAYNHKVNGTAYDYIIVKCSNKANVNCDAYRGTPRPGVVRCSLKA